MNPKSILGRYLIKQIIVNFITVLMMVLGVVLLFEVVELLRRTSGRDDVDFAFVMEMAVTKLPKTVEMVFPFVVMIAAMVTFWKLSKSNEFVIVRAAGVSIWGFLAPVLFATFAIGVINVTVVNPISANMYDLYETLEYRLKTKNPKAVLFSDQGLWIREAIDKDNVMVLQAKSVRQEKADLFLRDISILEMDRRSQPSRRLEAFAGTLKDGFFENDGGSSGNNACFCCLFGYVRGLFLGDIFRAVERVQRAFDRIFFEIVNCPPVHHGIFYARGGFAFRGKISRFAAGVFHKSR